jgi:hypothetical protein
VAPSPLALGAQALQHTLLATQTSAVATSHDMPRLSEFACPNDAPIHGLADKPLRLLLTDIGCGALASRSQTTRHTHNTTTSAIPTPSRRKTTYMAGLGNNPVQVFRTCRDLHWDFLRLWTGFELSSSWIKVPCYGLNRNRNYIFIPERCTHPRAADIPLRLSQRVLGVVPCPSLPDQTHTTPQLRLNWRSHGQNTICVQLLSICHSACTRLAAAPSRPLFLTDLDAAPSPLPDQTHTTRWPKKTGGKRDKTPCHCLVPRLRPTPSKQQAACS